MRCVEVRAGRPYEVFIGRGLMDAAGGMIVEALGGTRMAAILTDDTVDALYGARVEQALSESGLRTCRFAMPHGEAHKTLATWEKMLAFLSEQGMTRADAVVALGGGVPGARGGLCRGVLPARRGSGADPHDAACHDRQQRGRQDGRGPGGT